MNRNKIVCSVFSNMPVSRQVRGPHCDPRGSRRIAKLDIWAHWIPLQSTVKFASGSWFPIFHLIILGAGSWIPEILESVMKTVIVDLWSHSTWDFIGSHSYIIFYLHQLLTKYKQIHMIVHVTCIFNWKDVKLIKNRLISFRYNAGVHIPVGPETKWRLRSRIRVDFPPCSNFVDLCPIVLKIDLWSQWIWQPTAKVDLWSTRIRNPDPWDQISISFLGSFLGSTHAQTGSRYQFHKCIRNSPDEKQCHVILCDSSLLIWP